MKIDTSSNDPLSEISDNFKTSEIQISDADLERQHRRDDKVTLHRIKKICYYGFGAICTVFVIVWLWHVLMPERWRWLTENEITNIQSIALSIMTGAMASLVSSYFLKKKSR